MPSTAGVTGLLLLVLLRRRLLLRDRISAIGNLLFIRTSDIVASQKTFIACWSGLPSITSHAQSPLALGQVHSSKKNDLDSNPQLKGQAKLASCSSFLSLLALAHCLLCLQRTASRLLSSKPTNVLTTIGAAFFFWNTKLSLSGKLARYE